MPSSVFASPYLYQGYIYQIAAELLRKYGQSVNDICKYFDICIFGGAKPLYFLFFFVFFVFCVDFVFCKPAKQTGSNSTLAPQTEVPTISATATPATATPAPAETATPFIDPTDPPATPVPVVGEYTKPCQKVKVDFPSTAITVSPSRMPAFAAGFPS